ncbi:TetR/AcrR family transcriptional regulator [uncultured Croceicoccus sp.]|uniref:TetR/AcrR family transcriptional regulator n=1 Tax=uncultured Croceicoccus sp. TaxID=1295329 RepID=UPI002630FFC1|nr:TetR/AcrR family transcriptional regulator [uncultured Croceicoccus sp.]
MTERRGRGRPTGPDADTGAAISMAALHRFAAQGFEATSLREIAKDAGVDVALISYRFGGKTGLWKEIVSQASGDLREALDHALGEMDSADAQARLDHSARVFLAYLLDRPEVPRLLLRDITVDTDRSLWLLETLSLPLHRHFIALAQAAADERPAKTEHLQFRVANFIYSAASTVARRERLSRLIADMGADMEDDAQFAAALEATLVKGVLAL